MIRNFLAVVAALFLAALPISSQAAEPPAPWTMPRSDVRELAAPSGGTYRIFISWPEGPPPPVGYPILYTLDGNESFPSAASVALGIGPYLGFEPGIIVGIGYPGPSRRAFDYTPTIPEDTEMLMPSSAAGGADAMLDFIVKDVRPMIEAEFPVDRSRQTLAGYSLGGLFVLDTLFTHPDLFQTYVAASPSIWFGEKQVLKKEAGLSALLLATKAHPHVVLSAGEFEQDVTAPPGGGDAKWEKFVDLSRKARMVDNARELAERLEPLAERGLKVRFNLMPGETHATGVYPATRQSLTYAFSDKW